MTEQRSIDLSVEVPGSPEEVWRTIATGPGIAPWFVPMEVDGRVGGEVVMDFGGFGKDTATVTAWEPPRRIVYESAGERPLAYEWLVEARDGGTCVVRLVNRGFGAGEEWDGDYDGMTSGWKMFLQILRLHRTHFPGRTARAITPTVMVPGPNAAAWSGLCSTLGIAERPSTGDRLATTGEGVPVLAGTVIETATTPFVSKHILLLDTPAEGAAFIAAEGDGDQVGCSVYLYLYGEAGTALADEWTPWLTSRFGPLEVPAASSE